MTRDRSRRRAEGRSEAPRDASTAPFRLLQNPWPPLTVISPAAEDRLHEASVQILENTGIEFLDDEALDLFAQAGADVQRETRRVRIDRGLLLETIAKAPSSFTLHARNPERNRRRVRRTTR